MLSEGSRKGFAMAAKGGNNVVRFPGTRVAEAPKSRPARTRVDVHDREAFARVYIACRSDPALDVLHLMIFACAPSSGARPEGLLTMTRKQWEEARRLIDAELKRHDERLGKRK